MGMPGMCALCLSTCSRIAREMEDDPGNRGPRTDVQQFLMSVVRTA